MGSGRSCTFRPIAAAALVVLSLAGPVGAKRAPEPVAVFATRDTGFPAGEPTLGILPDNSIVFQAFAKTLKSVDGGRTWNVIHVAPTGDQTLDPYVHVDHATGRIFVSQLLVACQLLSISDNGGGTWIDAPTQCGTVDHQKLGSGPWVEGAEPPFYNRAVYTCVNHVAETACAVSLNGGLIWGPLVPVFPGVDPTADQGILVPGLCGGLEGDPVSGPDGTIYVPREYCGRPFVGVSRDNGVSWQIHPVTPDGQTRPIAFGGNNPAVTVSKDGIVFYAWTGDDWRHHLARSDDHGETWTDLGVVSPPDVLSTTFPLVIAGARDRVATAYVGTPDSDEGPDQAEEKARWYLYVSYSLDGKADLPRWTTVQVTRHPVMIGCIGRHGNGCTQPGHDALLDFNDIAITRTGFLAISYTDACRPPTCVDFTTNTSSEGMLAIQIAGPTFG